MTATDTVLFPVSINEADYTAPDWDYNLEQVEIKGSELGVHRNLSYTKRNGESVNIARTKVAIKWAYGYDSNGNEVLAMKVDDTRTFLKKVATEASLQAKSDHFTATRICRKLAEARANFEAEVAKMNEDVSKYGRFTNAEDLMRAQATKEVWEQLAFRAEHNRTEGATLLDLYNEIAGDLRNGLVQRASYLTSRSTSTFSNVQEDLKAEAQAAFINLM